MKTKEWSGTMENYTLKGNGGHTTLTVEMDATDEYQDCFKDTFPKALNKVKTLSEIRRLAN